MIDTLLSAKNVRAGEGKSLGILLGMDDVTVILSSEDTNGAFSLSEHVNPPGRGVPLHTHRREDETFHILEGEVEIQIGDETIIARKGDTAFLPRDIQHSWRVVGDSVARMLVTITPGGFDEFFTELSRMPANEPPDMERLLALSARYGLEFAPPAH